MNQSMPPPLPSIQSRSRMSLGGRLLNVFTGPGEVFEEIVHGPPSNANWLLPAALLCVVGVIAAIVTFSQDSVMQQIKEKQDQALEKRLAKVPQADRERIRETAEKFTSPALMKIFGSVGAVARSFGWLFFMAVLLWLLGTRVFKANFTYMQAVEVCGLAAMISVLGGIVSTLLVVVMGNTLATPGPALLIAQPNPANPAHLLLSAIDVMTVWYVGVLAIGLAKLSGAAIAKAAVWLFASWAAVTCLLISAGWLSQKMF